MSKYTDPRGVFDTLIEFAFAVFLIALLLWLAIDLLEHIWLWLLPGAAVASSIYVAIRIWLYRRDRW